MDTWILILVISLAAVFLFSLSMLIAASRKKGRSKSKVEGTKAFERKTVPSITVSSDDEIKIRTSMPRSSEKESDTKVIFENREALRCRLCRYCECENQAGAAVCEACGEIL